MKMSTTTTVLLRTLLWIGVLACTLVADVRIKNIDELIEIKDNVSHGSSFLETTIFLESDLSFAGKALEPIGTEYYKFFRGVFDGQGHVISDLTMAPSSPQFTGLFGYSGGLIIKNVILDSSCSFNNSYNSDFLYIGGIIGRCDANDGHCIIENSVNMGSVTFSGSANVLSFLGGIVGYISNSSNYEAIVKNCVNYGTITHSKSSENSRIAGIVGETYGSYIVNSLNQGTIMHVGTSYTSLYIGEISGSIYYATIENCVSAGKISSHTGSRDDRIGRIAGKFFADATINYCYFTSGSNYNKYGKEFPSSESYTLKYNSATFVLSGIVSVGNYSGNSLIEASNAYIDSNFHGCSSWLLNKEGKNVTFTINGRSTFKLDSQVILMPSLLNEGNMTFDGWYTDSGLTKQLSSYVITNDTELYGKYCGLNYTATFDVNGGDELPEKETIIDCDRVYGNLPTPNRTRYAFLGWFTEKTDGDKVKSGDNVTIFDNHTLYAHWIEYSLKKVEIIFGTKDIVQDDIEKIIKKYTDSDFVIVAIDSDNDETWTIVEFKDRKEATSFVDIIKGSGEETVKDVRIFFDSSSSFSSAYYPMGLLCLF